MPLAIEFFLKHGYLILFLWVALEQMGLPVPSLPVFLAAGSLTTVGRLSFPLLLLLAVAGCLLSDSIWYLLGKRFGGSVLQMLCRLSLEASSCVRRTEERFARYGAMALLFSKFVPGLSTVAPPIAGQTRMRYRTFLAIDAAGALLWSAVLLTAGRIFGDVLKLHPDALHWAGNSAEVLFVAAVLGFFFYRLVRQQIFLRQIRTARLDPDELKRMMDAGQDVFIVDLRHPLDFLPDPRVLPGALRISPDRLVQRASEIPRDRDIVLYCTCPSEATAAKTAIRLRGLGIYRVRPLRGGFGRWKDLGFPLVDYQEAVSA